MGVDGGGWMEREEEGIGKEMEERMGSVNGS